MERRLLGVALALVCALAATPASARHHHYKHQRNHHHVSLVRSQDVTCDHRGCHDGAVVARSVKDSTRSIHWSERTGFSDHIAAGDPRPDRWCMWWLRRYLGIPKSAFRPYEWNLARAGRYLGSAASGPAVGVIVVWWHHVGIITGRTATGWVVKSGNDDHAVRERQRSLAGAIAFRWPSGRVASR